MVARYHLLEVNQRHERLIDGLLVLASSRQLTRRNRVDLAEVAWRAVSVTQSAARQASEVTTRFVSSYVAGDPDLLERLAGNLIDNAIRYNAVTADG